MLAYIRDLSQHQLIQQFVLRGIFYNSTTLRDCSCELKNSFRAAFLISQKSTCATHCQFLA
jgi:hypothetical protein